MTQALLVVASMLVASPPGVDRVMWWRLRYVHMQTIRQRLRARYAPTSVNKILSAVRGVLHAAFQLGQIGAQDYQRAIGVKNLRADVLPAGRAFDRDEIVAMLQSCDVTSAVGARDAAMLSLLYGTGVRRAELVGINIGDIDARSGAVRVIGKGQKARIVYVQPGAAAAINAWLKFRGRWEGPLFLPVQKTGKIRFRRLSSQTVYAVVAKVVARCGLRKASPHDFRRTNIGDLLDAGADIASVQRLAGHAMVTTTARYDRRGERSRRAAAQLLDVPFLGPAQ